MALAASFAACLAASVLLCGASAVNVAAAEHDLVRHVHHQALGRAALGSATWGYGFKHRLRVCNAYPSAAPMAVYLKKHELTGDEPLPYKSCRDLKVPLKVGDKLKFKLGSSSAGIFTLSDLPNNDAMLFLAIHRHDTYSTAVSFTSHVFANFAKAQIAVIDTYKGSATATASIVEVQEKKDKDKKKQEPPSSKKLRFSSVMSVGQGVYEVDLESGNGETEGASELVALNRESYVIIRTGVEAEDGEAFPQELVVYPHSDVNALPHSSTRFSAVPAVILYTLAMLSLVLAEVTHSM